MAMTIDPFSPSAMWCLGLPLLSSHSAKLLYSFIKFSFGSAVEPFRFPVPPEAVSFCHYV
jgi:hypothetical protein